MTVGYKCINGGATGDTAVDGDLLSWKWQHFCVLECESRHGIKGNIRQTWSWDTRQGI